MADKIRPAISYKEEFEIAKKLGASDKQAKEIATKRMADPKAVPGNPEENKKMKEWEKTAKPGDYYTYGKGPGNIKEDAAKRGTQAGHHVTTSENHTKPVKSSGRGTVGGPIGDLGGGGMNWETK